MLRFTCRFWDFTCAGIEFYRGYALICLECSYEEKTTSERTNDPSNLWGKIGLIRKHLQFYIRFKCNAVQHARNINGLYAQCIHIKNEYISLIKVSFNYKSWNMWNIKFVLFENILDLWNTAFMFACLYHGFWANCSGYKVWIIFRCYRNYRVAVKFTIL